MKVFIVLQGGKYYGVYKNYPTKLQMEYSIGSSITNEEYEYFKKYEVINRMGYVFTVKEEELK